MHAKQWLCLGMTVWPLVQGFECGLNHFTPPENKGLCDDEREKVATKFCGQIVVPTVPLCDKGKCEPSTSGRSSQRLAPIVHSSDYPTGITVGQPFVQDLLAAFKRDQPDNNLCADIKWLEAQKSYEVNYCILCDYITHKCDDLPDPFPMYLDTASTQYNSVTSNMLGVAVPRPYSCEQVTAWPPANLGDIDIWLRDNRRSQLHQGIACERELVKLHRDCQDAYALWHNEKSSSRNLPKRQKTCEAACQDDRLINANCRELALRLTTDPYNEIFQAMAKALCPRFDLQSCVVPEEPLTPLWDQVREARQANHVVQTVVDAAAGRGQPVPDYLQGDQTRAAKCMDGDCRHFQMARKRNCMSEWVNYHLGRPLVEEVLHELKEVSNFLTCLETPVEASEKVEKGVATERHFGCSAESVPNCPAKDPFRPCNCSSCPPETRVWDEIDAARKLLHQDDSRECVGSDEKIWPQQSRRSGDADSLPDGHPIKEALKLKKEAAQYCKNGEDCAAFRAARLNADLAEWMVMHPSARCLSGVQRESVLLVKFVKCQITTRKIEQKRQEDVQNLQPVECKECSLCKETSFPHVPLWKEITEAVGNLAHCRKQSLCGSYTDQCGGFPDECSHHPDCDCGKWEECARGESCQHCTCDGGEIGINGIAIAESNAAYYFHSWYLDKNNADEL